MAKLVPIHVPLANPNDTTATLVEWLATQHAMVAAGEIVVRLETSKAIIDVDSPATGELEYLAEIGADLAAGEILGFIRLPVAGAANPERLPAVPSEPNDTARELALRSEDALANRTVTRDGHQTDGGAEFRFSRRAQLLARRIGADPEILGLVGLVRARDLLDAIERDTFC